MRVLLDSHILIWALDDPSKLSVTAIRTLQDPANEMVISAGTMWELSIKIALGKLTLSLPFREFLNKAIAALGLVVLPITLDHADRQSGLPFHHRDPFDRLLAAQSLVEGITIISADAIFDQYGVKRTWS
ncbi:MAG: type II toxin-antitoxin system VapC family toxin [Planctomycetota bacterium]|nr:type II toxin-antitoxin system VapC family toxin [Planctomycetota bacterium]